MTEPAPDPTGRESLRPLSSRFRGISGAPVRGTDIDLHEVDESIPAPPMTMAETGLGVDFVVELLLKHIQRRGQPTAGLLSERIALPVSVIEPVLAFMRAERLVEVPRRGELDAHVSYALTDLGRARADDAMRRSLYIGPAPVTLDSYLDRVERQKVLGQRVSIENLRAALSGTVVRESLLGQLGPAVGSGRSIFIYGPSGSGKTYLAEHLVDVMVGSIWVPHAILVEDQVIQVFDPAVHEPVAARAETRDFDRVRQSDARWVNTRRPVVRVGGELTLSMLDLEFDPLTRFYRAPAQVKANNGILILDDLGRQRTPVHEILNRWIVPLDRRVDYLTLHTGTKLLVPFDMIVVFSSNLSPSSLDDPAFVRRLGYKIYLGAMSEEEYTQVFRSACADTGVPYSEEAERYLIDELHRRTGTPLFAAYPAGLLTKIRHRAIFEGGEPELTAAAIEWAWRLYFAPDDEPDAGNQLMEE
ncbi:MAG: ATP-binding protein [Burkholderiaceae bacterium]|nr:ATP-binding protein [Burkholderiaceae bacterium]